MTLQEKEQFLKVTVPKLLEGLKSKQVPWWGKMNAHQMIEHLTDSLKNSTEKISYNLVTPPDELEKLKEFLMSDKEFKPGTKHPYLPEDPAPARTANIVEAYNNFVAELNNFFEVFKNNPDKQTLHPAFGSLNYEEWIQCHYKHFVHHLKQFDLLR